MSLAVEPPLSL
uniref:Uncharacterized protein n=1 Tax=Arundo donax TaxID=35708 RepID=A0A0A9AGU4_ARUDO